MKHIIAQLAAWSWLGVVLLTPYIIPVAVLLFFWTIELILLYVKEQKI